MTSRRRSPREDVTNATPVSNDRARSTGPAMEEVPAVLVHLFDAFDHAGLRWALLRPWEGLHSAEGDIDVLVGAAALEHARELLLLNGFLDMRTGGTGVHAANFDPVAGRFLWLHVQSTLKVGGLAIAGERLLDGLRREPFPELAPEWLMWAMLIRAIEKRHVPERYRARLRRLASEWRGGPAELEQVVIDRGLSPRDLVDFAAEGQWAEIVEQDRTSQKTNNRSFVRPRWVVPLSKLKFLFSRRRRGLSVAVIGPDGAGKSTLVGGLQRTLPLPTHVVYMGLTGGMMSRARRLRLPGLVFAVQAALLWMKFMDALRHRAAGKIVLFERYVLDGAVPAGSELSPLQRFARRVQRWILPSADLVVLLDASGRIMYDRKGEYSPETLETWRSHYRKLEATVSSLVVIDAEQDADHVLRTAQELIWERLRDRSA